MRIPRSPQTLYHWFFFGTIVAWVAAVILAVGHFAGFSCEEIRPMAGMGTAVAPTDLCARQWAVALADVIGRRPLNLNLDSAPVR